MLSAHHKHAKKLQPWPKPTPAPYTQAAAGATGPHTLMCTAYDSPTEKTVSVFLGSRSLVVLGNLSPNLEGPSSALQTENSTTYGEPTVCKALWVSPLISLGFPFSHLQNAYNHPACFTSLPGVYVSAMLSSWFLEHSPFSKSSPALGPLCLMFLLSGPLWLLLLT